MSSDSKPGAPKPKPTPPPKPEPAPQPQRRKFPLPPFPDRTVFHKDLFKGLGIGKPKKIL